MKIAVLDILGTGSFIFVQEQRRRPRRGAPAADQQQKILTKPTDPPCLGEALRRVIVTNVNDFLEKHDPDFAYGFREFSIQI